MTASTLYKLFKRTTTGATQVWWMEVVGGRYRTHSGQVDGKIVVSAWTQCEGKNLGRANETTPEDQAWAEADSKYQRKQKDGYRQTEGQAQSSTRFSPMLAKNFSDYKNKIKYPVLMQPKLDGIRCIATKDGLFSRKGDPIVSSPHIRAALNPIFAEAPHLVVDGELYNHDLHDNFNAIVSMVKKTNVTTETLLTTAQLVQYHVYDMYDQQQPALVFSERIKAVMRSFYHHPHPSLWVVPTLDAVDDTALTGLYEQFLTDGYEGAIVRVNSAYEQKRTSNLLKLKEFVDSEFIVLELVEGKGNAAGGAKIAWLQLDTDPKRKFKADIMGTVAERQAYLRDRKRYVGKPATVKYFAQRTPDGIPRFGKLKALWPDGKI